MTTPQIPTGSLRWRLNLLRQTYPAADVLVAPLPEREMVVMQAEILAPDPAATSGEVIRVQAIGACRSNHPSAWQVAEREAVEKALLYLGIGLDREITPHPADPVTPQAATGALPAPDAGAATCEHDPDAAMTADQCKRLLRIQQEAKWSDRQCLDWIRKELGPKSQITGDPWSLNWSRSSEELTYGQARRLVEAMRSQTR